MPIFPVQKPSKELLAALLVPILVEMQSSGTIKPESLREMLDKMREELEK